MKTNFYDDEIVAGKKILADQLKEAKAIWKQSQRDDWEDRKSLLKIMLAEIEADELAKKPKRGRPPLYTKDEIKERVRQQRKKCWDKHAKQYYENRRKKLLEIKYELRTK